MLIPAVMCFLGFSISIIGCSHVGDDVVSEQSIDPHEVLDAYVTASGLLGGEDEVLSICRVGKIYIQPPGDTLSYNICSRVPIKLRQIASKGGTIVYAGGYNGQYAWEIINGELSIRDSSQMGLEHRLDSLMGALAYLDVDSDVFSVKYGGLGSCGPHACYEILISDNLLRREVVFYIDTLHFLLRKQVNRYDSSSNEIYYSAFRKVNGHVLPYIWDRVSDPDSTRMTVHWDTIWGREWVSDTLFDPPAGFRTDDSVSSNATID